MVGNTIVECGSDLESRGQVVPAPEGECVFEGALTKAMRDRIVDDLLRILGQLDSLELWMAGAHVSSAIDLVQNESVVIQMPPRA